MRPLRSEAFASLLKAAAALALCGLSSSCHIFSNTTNCLFTRGVELESYSLPESVQEGADGTLSFETSKSSFTVEPFLILCCGYDWEAGPPEKVFMVLDAKKVRKELKDPSEGLRLKKTYDRMLYWNALPGSMPDAGTAELEKLPSLRFSLCVEDERPLMEGESGLSGPSLPGTRTAPVSTEGVVDLTFDGEPSRVRLSGEGRLIRRWWSYPLFILSPATLVFDISFPFLFIASTPLLFSGRALVDVFSSE